MEALLIYLVLVIMLALLSVVVVINFWRYHFEGDRTAQFITLYCVAFAAVVLTTLVLVNYRSLAGGGPDRSTPIDSPFGF
jgi:hypothetical protein